MVIDAGIVATGGLLALMSISSWTVMIRQWLTLRWMRRNVENLSNALIKHGNIKDLSLSFSNRSQELCKRMLDAAQGLHAPGGSYRQLDHQSRCDIALRAVLRSLDQTMSRGLGMLASIASTSPFVGLFGTVWGIFGALSEIAQVSEASIQAVAQPMGEALLMTAAGIAVALPAVVAYNRFSRMRKDLAQDLWTLAEDLRAIIISESRSRQEAASAQAISP